MCLNIIFKDYYVLSERKILNNIAVFWMNFQTESDDIEIDLSKEVYREEKNFVGQ